MIRRRLIGRCTPLAIGRSLRTDEDAVGYLSGLAAANRFPSMRAFCKTFGHRFERYRLGAPEAVQAFATRGGADTAELQKNLMVRDQSTTRVLGQFMRRSDVADRRQIMRFCPECLVEDVSSSPQLRPEVAVYQRLQQQLLVVHACPRHNIAIVEVPYRSDLEHDFAMQYRELLEANDPLLTPVPTPSTNLARLIEDRFAGNLSCPGFWTDQEIWEVTTSSLMLGRLMRGDRQFVMGNPSNTELAETAEVGFNALNSGSEGVYSILDVITSDVDRTASRSLPGPTKALGTFGIWLTQHSATSAFVSLRALVGRYLVDRKLVRLGDQWILGLPRPPRGYESLITMSEKYCTSERLLRQALLATGLLGPETARLKDSQILIDEEPIREFLENFASRMTKQEVANYLGVDERCVLAMVKDKLLSAPIVRLSSDKRPLSFFARPHVEAFQARLLEAATARPDKDLQSSLFTCRIVQRPLTTILRLIHDGKLTRVAAVSGRLDELLVDPAEIAAIVRPPPPGAYSVAECNKILELSPKNVGALLKTGHLPCIMIPRPTGIGTQRGVDKATLDAFRAELISISEIARIYGIGGKGVVARLAQFGIVPRFTSEEVGAPIFNRAEIAEFFADDGLNKLRRTFSRRSANWTK